MFGGAVEANDAASVPGRDRYVGLLMLMAVCRNVVSAPGAVHDRVEEPAVSGAHDRLPIARDIPCGFETWRDVVLVAAVLEVHIREDSG